MELLDYLVLVGYFLILIGIGIWTSRRIKRQVDYFMGGRSFGKLLQTFAAFGAGTGSSDPVNTGRTTYTSGMSGMWSVMYWLFVTPFYWITAVWYRRMRHLTLGDWFVERYQSRAMGVGYCIFGLLFFMVYGSMFFSAIGKVAAPLIGASTVSLFGLDVSIEYVLVPVIGIVVILYGILGGLEAAYFTDLIQGLCIILLSILLIPLGLQALVERFPQYGGTSMWDGFRIMHERLPESQFSVVGSTSTSEFPWYRILAVVLINLVGIVVQPHFIATGGGSAKTETNARVGLVVGNFLKRFCTIGWVLTALIAAALYAGDPVLAKDPDQTWGIASRDLLSTGLRGLMLACLLAALMSSVDAYMVVASALVVRNIYAPYINPSASEKQYVKVGRLTGAIVVAGAVLISLLIYDLFSQLQLTWVFGVLFAAPFWIGMYWRRATKAAAWITVTFCAVMFFGIPFFAPIVNPDLRSNPEYLTTNEITRTITREKASPSDLETENLRRKDAIADWEARDNEIQQMADEQEKQKAKAALGPKPVLLKEGDFLEKVQDTGGQSIFWGSGVKPVDSNGNPIKLKPQPVGEPVPISSNVKQVQLQYPDGTQLKGFGNFKLDFLLYRWMGMDLQKKSSALLATLELPIKIVAPFLVMILFSLVTPRTRKEALDRYYAKMKTPVIPDHEADQAQLEETYANLEERTKELEGKKLFPGTSLEFQKPTRFDVYGFIVSFLVCFAIIGIAVLVASIK